MRLARLPSPQLQPANATDVRETPEKSDVDEIARRSSVAYCAASDRLAKFLIFFLLIPIPISFFHPFPSHFTTLHEDFVKKMAHDGDEDQMQRIDDELWEHNACRDRSFGGTAPRCNRRSLARSSIDVQSLGPHRCPPTVVC